jgi:ATP-dependent DNA helicase HFM1/MER3
VVGAPTGSGKTVVMELAIIRLMMQVQAGTRKSMKVVFIAPNKALCQQKLADFTTKFESFGLIITEVTGDVVNGMRLIAKSSIILTTPEKW